MCFVVFHLTSVLLRSTHGSTGLFSRVERVVSRTGCVRASRACWWAGAVRVVSVVVVVDSLLIIPWLVDADVEHDECGQAAYYGD